MGEMGCGSSAPVQPGPADENGEGKHNDSRSTATAALENNDSDVAPAVLDIIMAVVKGDTTTLDLSLPAVTPAHAEAKFPAILEVPTRIMTLVNLEVLSLKNNRINILPDNFFKELGRLKKLDLSQNALRSMPTSIDTCTELTEIDLSENYISELPVGLGQCTKITSIIVFKNALTVFAEELFAGMTQLTVLNAFNNKLTSLPSSLAGLPLLEDLSLGSNKLKSFPQPHSEGWKRLKRLALMDNRLQALPSLEACASTLAILQLSENQLTSVPHFGAVAAVLLETLELSTNKLETLDDSLAKSCPAVKVLNVRRNNLMGVLPAVVLQLPALEVVDAQNNDILVLPDNIDSMLSLTTLLLNKNKLQRVPASILSCPRLMRVRMEGCPLPIVGEATDEARQVRTILWKLKQQCEERGGFFNVTGTLQPPT